MKRYRSDLWPLIFPYPERLRVVILWAVANIGHVYRDGPFL